jgi:hypothetical protein
MQPSYVVTGVLSDGRTVTLDEPLPLTSGKVRVVVEPVAPEPKPDLSTFLERIWDEQRCRGHVPPTKEEVDAYIRAERDSWDD